MLWLFSTRRVRNCARRHNITYIFIHIYINCWTSLLCLEMWKCGLEPNVWHAQQNILRFSVVFLSYSGELQWTVLSSDISNSDETRKNLAFCDFQPATWYQFKVSAINDAGKTTALYNVATTKLNGGNYYHIYYRN